MDTVSGKCLIKPVLLLLLSVLSVELLNAQEIPPIPIEVTVLNNISFGAFTQAAGAGSVTVTHDGFRSASNIILLTMAGYPYFSGRIEIVGNEGTPVSILPIPPITLTRSGGGGSMILNINQWNVSFPYILLTTPPSASTFYFGGILNVGLPASNPPGSYSGNFVLTFVQNE